jgi:hypothetical protein
MPVETVAQEDLALGGVGGIAVRTHDAPAEQGCECRCRIVDRLLRNFRESATDTKADIPGRGCRLGDVLRRSFPRQSGERQ